MMLPIILAAPIENNFRLNAHLQTLVMPSISDRIEYAIGRLLHSVRQHDSKLFTRTSAFNMYPDAGLFVTCPECEDTGSELQTCHTPMGENRFPGLSWQFSDGVSAGKGIAQYLVVVEDPDAPLPQPVVHGIYYTIPSSKTSLQVEDLEPIAGEKPNELRGCRHGLNRRKTVWSGPRPVLGHGSHRYIFQVVGLNAPLDEDRMSEIPTRAEVERAIQGKVAVWGTWVGHFERLI